MNFAQKQLDLKFFFGEFLFQKSGEITTEYSVFKIFFPKG
jgi:hypothetical protein